MVALAVMMVGLMFLLRLLLSLTPVFLLLLLLEGVQVNGDT